MGIPFIEVSGDARERGRQHGEAAREQVRRSVAFYKELLTRRSGSSWDEILTRAPSWNAAVEEFLPGILDEVRGIAEGSAMQFEEILAVNARTDLSRRPGPDESGCSSYAVTQEASGDGHVYCGQNWDYRDAVSDTVIVLRIHQPPKPTVITQTEAGQVARQGANSAGLALNANGLSGAIASRGRSIPWAYRLRHILDSSTMFDALQVVFGVSQSGCANLLLTHREGVVVDIETTPQRHAWMYPTDGVLVHTNHFIAFVPPQIAESYRPSAPDSLYRLDRIQRELRRLRPTRSPEATRGRISAALRDHFGAPNAVCNHPDPRQDPLERTETVLSSIVDLTSGEYYVTSGPPCATEYEKLPWNLYEGTLPPSDTARPS